MKNFKRKLEANYSKKHSGVFVSGSLSDTASFARGFLEKLETGRGCKPNRAIIVGLSGELGSGKTAFVQCVARALGVKEHITSPTFVIIKSYELSAVSYKLLIHVDAYRLKSGEELLKLGWHEFASDPANLIFIEWPERVREILPSDFIQINFEFVDGTTRKIGMEERRKKTVTAFP